MQRGRKPASIQPKVRLPADLHKRLWRAAQKDGRTLNGEIVRRLERSFHLEQELEEAKRRLSEQDLLKLAREHLDKAKELQEGLEEHARTSVRLPLPKGSEK